MSRTTCRRHQILALLLLVFATKVGGQPPDDFVQKALNDSSFTWLSYTSNRIKIFYQEGSFAQKHRMMLVSSMKTTVDEVLRLLDEPRYDRILNVFYLDSRDQMKRIVGSTYAGFSDWGGNAIFLVLNPEWRSFEKHEFTHVITMGVWGPPDETSRWMIEGIAVYSDGWCRENSVDEIASYLLSENRLPTLHQLFDDYASLGEIRAGFSAASFIGFIHRTYGMSMVHRLWAEGVKNLGEVLGSETNQIESAWKLYLKRNAKKDVHVDLDTINNLGCG
jgi:hypothetical protein